MPKSKTLLDHFKPISYSLEKMPDDSEIALTIIGRRSGRPSSRLTLHQKGLKIKSAKLTYHNKNKVIEYEVNRINHLPSFQEVRLHSSRPLYPGEYIVELIFEGSSLDKIRSRLETDLENTELRTHLPSIDEPEAKKEVVIEIK
jgi:hypothetical protein